MKSFGIFAAGLYTTNAFVTAPLSAYGYRGPLRPSTAPKVPSAPILPSKSANLWPPNLPVVPADDSWGNWAVLLGTASIAQVLGKSTAIGRLLGPPVSAMALTFGLASIGILNPGGTLAAKSLQLLALQLATPLILLGADLRDASRRCGPLLVSFLLASLSTFMACLVGWQLAGPGLTTALGRDGLVIAAALLAKNIGGGINYIAVANSLQASPTAIAAGLCVDNIMALIYFPATSALASGHADVEVATGETEEQTDPGITVESLSAVLFLSAVLLWLGERIGGPTGSLPLCTILTVIVASKAPLKWMLPLRSSAQVLGTVGLYVFFATAGAPGLAVADSVKASLGPLSLFLICLYSVHGLILAALHRAWGQRVAALRPQRLLVASSAAIGGPATAVALASAAGWDSLQVPSLIVGNIGYAVATFCGLGYYAYFRP